MENNNPISLGVTQVPAKDAINGGTQPLATAEPILNYPRNEELIVQCVISSKDEGLALLRAIQLIVNTFGAVACTEIVTHLEKNPNLVDKARKYITPFL